MGLISHGQEHVCPSAHLCVPAHICVSILHCLVPGSLQEPLGTPPAHSGPISAFSSPHPPDHPSDGFPSSLCLSPLTQKEAKCPVPPSASVEYLCPWNGLIKAE